MRRGEVWRVSIPFAPGHAQAGERPAVLLQDDTFTASLPTVLVVPFTGNLRNARRPGTLVVQPDGTNGLAVTSVALVFQMRVLDKRGVLQRLGVLDSQILDQILVLLDRLTGR